MEELISPTRTRCAGWRGGGSGAGATGSGQHYPQRWSAVITEHMLAAGWAGLGCLDWSLAARLESSTSSLHSAGHGTRGRVGRPSSPL